MVEVHHDDNQLHIRGDIGFVNVESCLDRILVILREKGASQADINFKHVKHMDGSIIALMTSLLRQTKSLGIKVNYFYVPEHILRVSELYGVRNILPIITQ